MQIKTQRIERSARTKSLAARATERSAFNEVVRLIEASRTRALAGVNTALIDRYWSIGEHISRRIAADGWGKNTVKALAEYIRRSKPGIIGFSAQNLWRMRQFYETYHNQPKLAPLL